MSKKPENPSVKPSEPQVSGPLESVLNADMIASNVAASSRQVPVASELSIIDEIYEFAAKLRSDPAGPKDET
jgi:hypothetical protein